MNTLWHTSIRHVTHEYVMSHMNMSCHTWICYVTHQHVMSRMNEVCHLEDVIWTRHDLWKRHVTHECVIFQVTSGRSSLTYPPPPSSSVRRTWVHGHSGIYFGWLGYAMLNMNESLFLFSKCIYPNQSAHTPPLVPLRSDVHEWMDIQEFILGDYAITSRGVGVWSPHHWPL